MAYNKRRYRRVSVPYPIDRAWWHGAKVTMFADGTWWVNGVGESEGYERPRFIALDGVHIDPFKKASEHQKTYGIVTVRTSPSLAPTHYGDRAGRTPPWTKRSFEDRFKPIEGGLRVPR